MLRIIMVILITPQLLLCKQKFSENILIEGDIIFHESMSQQSKAIKLSTYSRYTHVGIIFKYKNRFFVMEAVQPVTITPLNNFINRGIDSHFVIKRLREHKRYLTKENIRIMKSIGNQFLGKNYDLYFGWSDDRIYCSELVWKIFKRTINIEVGKLQKLGDFDLKHAYVKNLLLKRYGSKVPYNETVISPAAIFESDLLMTVYE